MASIQELQAWIAQREEEVKSVGRRNIFLLGALAVGVLLLLVVCWWLYAANVRAYAALENVVISRNPANQGRLQISFRVLSPGKVFYRRTSGKVKTEVVDYFESAGQVDRAWSWVYEPGEDIDVSVLYRGWLWRRTTSKGFPTASSADIVILMDTTGSMSRSINLLKEKCVAFSSQLERQALSHRFALIGFGDSIESEWLDTYGFTDNAEQFQQSVSEVRRFDGGDLPESALDALEAGFALPFDQEAIRRFYLVTDAQFHEPTKKGATVADIAARLDQEQILLNVFTRGEYASDYAQLLRTSGKVEELSKFGHVLAEGRILED
ncbi:MAG: vWA domain-containing protein [Planctomycetota bacterium]